MIRRPPAIPDRGQFSGSDLESFDALTKVIDQVGTSMGAPMQTYAAALSNAPGMSMAMMPMSHVLNTAPDDHPTFSHADREWAEQVMCWDWDVFTGQPSHIHDALKYGIRAEAIRALAERRESDFTPDETLLTNFTRCVRDGKMTDAVFSAMAERIGLRGAVEFAIFVGHVSATFRIMQALMGDRPGPGRDELMAVVNSYIDGSQTRPADAMPQQNV